ncbi:pyruvate decarboxylase PdcB [Sporodiniella umbellata]|nr:pyruvate decarboxylase PdcB [Sporodiniella umbellata]
MIGVTIGQHLINRLKELNIDTVFGVPGDFIIPFVSLVEEDPNLTWGNNANELNASYAADGYARIRGAGVLATTFGVGELSATNGIAGSYSEMVPVIHIVGNPTLRQRSFISAPHHSLAQGKIDAFFQVAASITCAYTQLTQYNAIEEIDRVISKAMIYKRPGYIAVPANLFNMEVLVPEKIDPLQIKLPINPSWVQSSALKETLKAIDEAKFPIIVVDGCVARHGIQKLAQDFIKRSGFPTYVTPLGKGIVDETLSSFRGIYHKEVGFEATKEELSKADLIIELGAVKAFFNTSTFADSFDQPKTISLHSFTTIIFKTQYKDVSMTEFLPLLTESLPKTPRHFDLGPRPQSEPTPEGTEITHSYLWNKLPDYLEEDIILCAETGSLMFATSNLRIPRGTLYISQFLYASIGYSIGAAVGAAMAARDRRVYLIVGDGSFQMTCQEISLFLRHGLTPVILLLNNDGYMIEHYVTGVERCFNTFQMWEYGKSLDYFGARIKSNPHTKSSFIGFQGTVSTRDEFEKAMEQTVTSPDKIHFLEVVMPRRDIPRELKAILTVPLLSLKT